MTSVVAGDRPVAKPNISASGRRRRLLSGVAGFTVALLAAFVLIGVGAAWYWRAVGVFVPTVVGASGWLQARRQVADTIQRDALVVGLVAAAIAAATALVR